MSAIDTEARQAIHFRILESRTFWVSHVNGADKTWQQVQPGIRDLIDSLAEGEIWESRSLYIFNSFATIDHIALMLGSRVRVKDAFVVGSFTHAECRVVGSCDDKAFFDLVPFAKRAYGKPLRRPELSQERTLPTQSPFPEAALECNLALKPEPQ